MSNSEALLFDTQAIICWASETPPDEVATRVQGGCPVYVSIVSFWEFLLKSRYHDLGITFQQIRQVVRTLDAIVLPIHLQHLETLEQLPTVGMHRDPFDRLIISQAISEGYVLVGKDREFAKYCKTAIGRNLAVLWE